MYLTSTKLINLIIIIAIVGISSFGCQNSAPKQTKTQASPATQADTETGVIDPADIPTLPQTVPQDQLLSPTLPENYTDLATQPDPQVDLPKLPETKVLSPRKSKPQTVAPKEPETQRLLPTPETEAVSLNQSEIKPLLPTEPEIKPLLPTEPEIQSLLPTKPKTRQLSPIKPETPTVFLTPPETQIALLRPPKREASPGSFMDIKNLPDGNYFYGESPEFNSPGREYLVFKKKGDLIIGQQYVLQTDNAHCFRGTANSSQINNVKTAYFQPSDNGMKLAFGQMDAIGTNNLHQLGFEKAPDFVTQNLQECIRVFTQEKISMAY